MAKGIIKAKVKMPTGKGEKVTKPSIGKGYPSVKGKVK